MHYILAAIIRYDENETERVIDYLETAKPNFIFAVSKQLEPSLAKFGLDDKAKISPKLDQWEVDDIIVPEDFLANLPEMESLPQAVLTPGLEWIDSENTHLGLSSDLWEDKIKQAVISAGDSCLVAIVRCHI